MEIGEDIQTGNVGGGGFGAPDVSDDLKDMTNYEKAICNTIRQKEAGNKTIFELLSELVVMPKNATVEYRKKYKYVTLDASDIEDMNAASMGAAGHGVNSEFAALGIPFRAVPFASKDAPKVTKTYGVNAKDASKVGKEHDVTETDCLKIYRTGAEFDPALYAVKGGDEGSPYKMFGQRVSTKGKNAGEILVYETFTFGQGLRADGWLIEVAVEKIDKKVLAKIGLEVE